MAEWIGQLLATFPDWLFIPGLITVIIVTVLLYLGYFLGDMPMARKVYLGEKKHGKK